MTLIEIMITLAIVAMVLGLVGSRVGGSFDSKAAQATQDLSAIIRYLYNKAASEGLTMRVVIDMGSEKQSYWVEATADRFLLESDEAREARLRNMEKSDGKSDSASKTSVQTAEDKFGPVDSHLLKPTELPDGVFFKDVYTDHDPGPVSAKKAYIHIFPDGSVERAVVNFRNEDDTQHRAVEINPMTGDSRFYEEYKELKK